MGTKSTSPVQDAVGEVGRSPRTVQVPETLATPKLKVSWVEEHRQLPGLRAPETESQRAVARLMPASSLGDLVGAGAAGVLPVLDSFCSSCRRSGGVAAGSAGVVVADVSVAAQAEVCRSRYGPQSSTHVHYLIVRDVDSARVGRKQAERSRARWLPLQVGIVSCASCPSDPSRHVAHGRRGGIIRNRGRHRSWRTQKKPAPQFVAVFAAVLALCSTTCTRGTAPGSRSGRQSNVLASVCPG